MCEGSDITEIHLPEQGLSNVLADSLQYLTALKVLDLSNNHELSGQFPDFLNRMTALTHLDISNCKLRGRVLAWNYTQYAFCSIGGRGNRYCDPVPTEALGCNRTAIVQSRIPCRRGGSAIRSDRR